MLIIRKKAYARAGFVGNPSDGYGGKTIAFSVRDFEAQVTLYEWDRIELVPSQEDQSRFSSIQELAQDVSLHGYYGGIRLVKATIKKFAEYCIARGLALHERNFSVRYETSIPRQVGLAGSSAIIVATLRALMEFYDILIPEEVQPSFILSVEREELRIMAGLQDRVIQVYEGCVSMDFGDMRMQDGFLRGTYERIDPSTLPPVYLAYNVGFGEPTEVLHNDLRARFEAGEPGARAAMQRLAEITSEANEAIASGDADLLGRLVDENFNVRRSICRLPPEHIDMIERARKAGASAKFAGSGGAIVGVCPDESTFQRLEESLGEIKCRVIRPTIE